MEIKDRSGKMTITTLRQHDHGAEMRQEGCIVSTSAHRRAERGVALLVVLVLSAVALALITALLYMISVGTQTSGMHKTYRTALEAGVAGADLMYEIVEQRDDASINTLLSNWQAGGLINSMNTSLASCSGTAYASGSGVSVTGAAAKNMTTRDTWTNCGVYSLATGSASYDYTFVLGTSPQYTVYAKITDVREGNTGSSVGGGGANRHILIQNPVVGGGSGEIATPSIPYLYEMEIDAENNVKPEEHAKLSILYQY